MLNPLLSTEEINQLGFRHIGWDIQTSRQMSVNHAQMVLIGDFSRIDDFCGIFGFRVFLKLKTMFGNVL